MLNDTLRVLSRMTETLPIGTNLGLLHVLWVLVSGALLASRGALFPALKSIGLSDEATRRAWAAFRKGQWQIKPLVETWRSYVKGQTAWRAHRIEGYVPIAVDVTAFWRPSLKTAPSQHYHPVAQRALPAVIIGLAGEVGEIAGQRLALPRRIERVHPRDGRETRLWADLLKQVGQGLQADEIVVVKGRTLRVEIWRDLVLPKTSPDPANSTVDVYAFHDPAFKHPWLLACSVKLRFESVHALYIDRWPVEQIPLSAKQMLGTQRQFVHAPESVQPLPELALLAGSMVSVLAATFPPLPAGFWDRHPKRTPGRFRRALLGQPFPKDAILSVHLREKRALTDHLPKDSLARTSKTAQTVPLSIPLVV
jgi:hypothetical protein